MRSNDRLDCTGGIDHHTRVLTVRIDPIYLEHMQAGSLPRMIDDGRWVAREKQLPARNTVTATEREPWERNMTCT